MSSWHPRGSMQLGCIWGSAQGGSRGWLAALGKVPSPFLRNSSANPVTLSRDQLGLCCCMGDFRFASPRVHRRRLEHRRTRLSRPPSPAQRLHPAAGREAKEGGEKHAMTSQICLCCYHPLCLPSRPRGDETGLSHVQGRDSCLGFGSYETRPCVRTVLGGCTFF